MMSYATPLPLPLATPGMQVRITGFSKGEAFMTRLAGMGLCLGTELHVLQQEGGNMVLALGNTRIALGLGLAQRITIVPATSFEQQTEQNA